MMDIIICDDHPVVRVGLVQLISTALNNGTTVREAATAQRLFELMRENPPDAVVLDVGLPGRSGLDVLRELKQEFPKVPVVVLSVHPSDMFAVRALRDGASAYLTKESATEELVQALRATSKGYRYVTPVVAELLAAELQQATGTLAHESLTAREFEVLRHLGTGCSTRQIADSLCLSHSTVGTYRARVMRKLRVKTIAQLIRYAVHHRLDC